MIAADAAAGLASGIIGGLDKLFTSDQEREEAKRKLTETLQAPLLGQLAINKAEAESAGVFKGGWRPAIGWVGAISLAYQYVIRDLLVWALTVWAPEIPPPPALDAAELFALITGMLGLAGSRSYDLAKGSRK